MVMWEKNTSLCFGIRLTWGWFPVPLWFWSWQRDLTFSSLVHLISLLECVCLKIKDDPMKCLKKCPTQSGSSERISKVRFQVCMKTLQWWGLHRGGGHLPSSRVTVRIWIGVMAACLFLCSIPDPFFSHMGYLERKHTLSRLNRLGQ